MIFGKEEQRATHTHLKAIVHTLITKECLAHFTWTGRTKTGEKKRAFKNLQYIRRILIVAIKNFDAMYGDKEFHKQMVDHVLKYAYLGEIANKKTL